jgi:cytochrome c-type biogenesis protein CcmH/NrfG
MRPMLKATIALMVVLVVFYAVLTMLKGAAMVQSGGAVGVLLGLAVLVAPLLGLALVARELWFGRQCARMAEQLDDEGGLDAGLDDLPRRPSGRVDRSAADEHFAKVREETEADPDRWQSWYRLSLAYDAAGDRSRARAAARHAIELHRRAAL